MLDLLAHITQREIPSVWLAGLIGFVAGMAVTFGVMIRREKGE